MGNNLAKECEECGRSLSPMEAEDSYAATFSLGDGGVVLCGKHLDRKTRQ